MGKMTEIERAVDLLMETAREYEKGQHEGGYVNSNGVYNSNSGDLWIVRTHLLDLIRKAVKDE